MSASDVNSTLARMRYRAQRAADAVRQRVTSPAPPPQPADAQAAPSERTPPEARAFQASAHGSGAFGEWIVDEQGLPAYRYDMNQFEDDRAKYPVSTGAFRRDHWHQIGNDRVTGLASNDGTVQLVIADQGYMFLNHFSHGQLASWLGTAWEVIVILLLAIPRGLRNLIFPSKEPSFMERLLAALNAPTAHKRDDLQHAYAGGFGYVQVGDEVWSTAYRYHPDLREQSERVFGMGYYRTCCTHNGIRTERVVYAPPGDVSAVLTDVYLTNQSDEAVTLNYYDYWDVNIQQLQEQLLRTGQFGAAGDVKRRHLNRQFTPDIVYDENAKALRFHLHPPAGAPAPIIPDGVNWKPDDIFLADLSGTPDGKYTDKAAFFGQGGAENPDGIHRADDSDLHPIPSTIMPYCMVLRRKVTIPAGETRQLRFGYGTIQSNLPFWIGPSHRANSRMTMPQAWVEGFQQRFHLGNAPGAFKDLCDHWKQRVSYFSLADMPYLQREIAWHAYYMLSSTMTSTYFDSRVVPQGSAYLFIHGIDGAPRDFALYIMALCFIDPKLAREMLGFIMRMTSGDSGQIAYSYTGNGRLSGTIIHEHPSDLDLFFLMALTEYIAVTGDSDFLLEDVPFYNAYNQPGDQRVLSHVRVAYNHLLHIVGIGDNDLIRVSDGDWSDDVVVRNVFPSKLNISPRNTIAHGESVLNSQMAVYILPRLANLLMQQDHADVQALGEEMKEELEPILAQLTEGINRMWMGTHYARAILRTWRNNTYVLDAKDINLESQVWALITNLDPDVLPGLIDSIYKNLDEPSPIGAMLSNGTVWPAVSQILTWGYTLHDPEKAWRSFLKQTFSTRAEVYGHRWSNIWSGPDGVNGPTLADPGGTYQSPPATPMMDFPVMNNNQHAMTLLALLRVCGIEAHESGAGIRIRPQTPTHYELDVPLIKLDVSPERISGIYRAQNDGRCDLFVRLAADSESVEVSIDDTTTTQLCDDEGYVRLTLPPFTAGDEIRFVVSR
ncbi:MAG: hypothetical protein CL607_26360 [Anaerolineaceae bacterium]|nr:hypothetical protein [Anaerolineaceae bacterium]